MARVAELTQRSRDDGFQRAVPVDFVHMSAHSCLGWRSGFHHRGFETPEGQSLEIWWTVDMRTGALWDVFEDARGLNLPSTKRTTGRR